mmetsp:Transcript_64898/g.107680  ORF Transcript_64898/g.107680 Transcript_64898/m.107680 type:complete len:432 (-) Transcript_64898:292-1587(-)
MPLLCKPCIPQRLNALLCGRRHGPANGIWQRGLVDVERGVGGAGHTLQRQERAAQQDDVWGCADLIVLTESRQASGEGSEARGTSLLGFDAVPQCADEFLFTYFYSIAFCIKSEVAIGRDESNCLENTAEAVPIPRYHILDALGKALHNVGLHAGNEAEIKKDQLTVVCQQHISFMRICVHKPSVEHLCHTCFHGHLRHQQLFLLGQITERFAFNPFHGQDSRLARLSHVFRQPFRGTDVPQICMQLVELVSVGGLTMVIQFIEHANGHLIRNGPKVRVVAPGPCKGLQTSIPTKPVQRHLFHDTRPLHLHCHRLSIPCLCLVNLPQTCTGNRLWRDVRKQWLPLWIGIGGARHIRCDRAIPLQIVCHDSKGGGGGKWRAVGLQTLEGICRLLADNVRPLRQCLPNFQEHWAQSCQGIPEHVSPCALFFWQ